MKLKKKIELLHTELEQQSFYKRLRNGNLSGREYIKYLQIMYSIFNELEKNELPTNELKRVNFIIEDLKELRGTIDNSKLAEVYVKYLNILPSDKRLSHIYFNYLELIITGADLKKSVPGTGRVYTFNNEEKCVKSIKRMENNEWLDEVNRGYIFWIDIFRNLEK